MFKVRNNQTVNAKLYVEQSRLSEAIRLKRPDRYSVTIQHDIARPLRHLYD